MGSAAIAVAAPAEAAGAPQTYYVSASGDDALAGTSPATAWRTLQPVNARVLAGDTVLLQGGATFAGPLDLNSQDNGVTVGFFGPGRASLTGAGITGYDVSGVTLRDLDLDGDPTAFTSQAVARQCAVLGPRTLS
ncbi:MAG TPA: hypothetical protein VHB69_13275 [Mycobacteriales bacterium]|nr:hypothetical protein [Mycobacteriales bacterium]